MTESLSSPTAARECGECTMCCKLLGVEAIDKPEGTWCPHCTARRGCAIYDSRPQQCRDFVCAWLKGPALDERWKPSVCKFIVFAEQGGGMMLKVAVDPVRPDAWRKEPFYSYFKNWIRQNAVAGGVLLVLTGKRAVAVLPDRDTDLGDWTDDDRVVVRRAETEFGPRFDVLKVHKDDPRAQEAVGE
jgi:Fe-S-cluster containining protein